MTSIKRLALIPILLSLFVMGFADFAAIASNYAKVGLGEDNATMSALLPTIAYLMCPFIAYPAYRLTYFFGRKRTIMLSLFIVALGALLPLVHIGFATVTVSLVTLGIGNTMLYVSLVPLLASIVKAESLLPIFSLGQGLRMLPTCVAPLTIVAAASSVGPHCTFEWSLLCVVYSILALFALALFAMTPLDDEEEEGRQHAPHIKVTLLHSPIVLFTLFIVFCNTGVDIGMGAIMPQVLSERLNISIFDAIHSSGIYYLMRSLGCMIGVMMLSNESNKRNFLGFVGLMAVSLLVLLFTSSQFVMLTCIALTGIGSANILSISFCKILNLYPSHRDEASAFVITAFCGGAFMPMLMASASARLGIETGLVTMLVGVMAMVAFYYYVFREK